MKATIAVNPAQKMLQLATQQLTEHKAWLKKTYARLVEGKTPPFEQWMWEDMVDSIRLKVVTRDPTIKDDKGQPTVSTLVEYPDDLYDYLNSLGCPLELKEAIVGGFSLEGKKSS